MCLRTKPPAVRSGYVHLASLRTGHLYVSVPTGMMGKAHVNFFYSSQKYSQHWLLITSVPEEQVFKDHGRKIRFTHSWLTQLKLPFSQLSYLFLMLFNHPNCVLKETHNQLDSCQYWCKSLIRCQTDITDSSVIADPLVCNLSLIFQILIRKAEGRSCKIIKTLKVLPQHFTLGHLSLGNPVRLQFIV